ncbi:MAG: CBS domain-containing protein [Proteobacteria bacterium]|nr:CBS domain-containing protein [Pseudomonadota bacterium]
MELYLDSADINEIEEAFKLGYIDGLTTTPTFMHREGVTDLDAMILKLAGIVPVLQIEALGSTAEEIFDEAQRQLDLGLDKTKTVFKIPVSLEGTRACKMLRNKGFLVNLHLVYTLQQAYMAMHAGATYVCPLVGRLQDQGQDALGLVRKCVEAVDKYGYDTNVMFSSVRHSQHVRNALDIGVHTCTIPWKVMKQLTENHFTTIGTDQFFEHTRLITETVGENIRDFNPIIPQGSTVLDALVRMTQGKFGAVAVVDDGGQTLGVFTDGDLRRNLEKEGQNFLQKSLSELSYSEPITIDADALLIDATKIFKDKKVDTVSVVTGGKQIGMLDIQDLV